MDYAEKIKQHILSDDDIVDSSKTYIYEGQGVSMNDYYNSGDWRKRNGIKKKYKEILTYLIKSQGEPEEMDKFGLLITFNSKHDPDNVFGFGKIFVDVLKDVFGCIEDDSRHYYKMCASIPNLDLPMNTFEFTVIKYGSN